MKLISMKDYVLYVFDTTSKQKFRERVELYAKFITQPLTLGMFVPCDEDGNILPAPVTGEFAKGELSEQYQQAKERVLFSGKFEERNKRDWCIYKKYHPYYEPHLISEVGYTVEDIIEYDLTLTKSAQKQIGL